MSTRVFAAFRRNQKQWMVVLTVLSMVSFLFLDDFGRGKGPMSAFGGGLMIGCLCAAGMCIIGYSRQKTVEFGQHALRQRRVWDLGHASPRSVRRRLGSGPSSSYRPAAPTLLIRRFA